MVAAVWQCNGGRRSSVHSRRCVERHGGCCVRQMSYLRNPWNRLDFAVVVFSVVNLTGSASKLAALRALRALRPLRAVSRFPSLKLMVYALANAVPQIVNVMILCGLFFLLFAIAFVTFFKGALYNCAGPVFDALTQEQVR